jgi:2-polyprenyl-6-methoxyphenol hydroxylase-like FAD-dependent oxidoreductase
MARSRATPQLGLPHHDVAIIGAGPVGLALAIELARGGLSVLVLDRRPPLEIDAQLRPQLLVARAGDLANLEHLGIDIHDEWIVTMLQTRVETDLASGTVVRGEVRRPDTAPAQDLWTLASQPPLALVPIGRLQQALHERALQHGVTVAYESTVTRMRRHARHVSISIADGSFATATIAIIATGAARSLLGTLRGFAATQTQAARMIAGLFAVGGDRARWIRAEVPVDGFARATRATLLQTPSDAEAGTALLVDPQVAETPEQFHHCFDAAARAHGLLGAPCLVKPQIFSTALSSVQTRFVGLDGRAPIIVAGDAAQTGHVFSGQTCFVNLALALRLAEELVTAKRAIAGRKINDPAIARALGRYHTQSEMGSAILARSSARHYAAHQPGGWALAGVARA